MFDVALKGERFSPYVRGLRILKDRHINIPRPTPRYVVQKEWVHFSRPKDLTIIGMTTI